MEGKLLRLEFLSPMYDVLLKPGETTLEVRARIAAGIRRDAVAGRAKGAMVEPAPPASQIDA